MPAPVVLVGIELLVTEIDAALVLLEGAFGLDVVERHNSTDPAGEIAVLDAGGVTITLLQAADHGPGYVLPRREPRVTQLVFGVPGDDAGAMRMAVGESGVPTLSLGDGGFYVPPTGGEGLFGFEIAAVLTSLSDVGTD